MTTQTETQKKAKKVRVHTLLFEYFPHALLAVAEVSEVGSKKYGEGGPTTWKDFPVATYQDAKGRHMLKDAAGDVTSDDGEGITHAAQEAWNALAVLEKLLTE